VTDPSVSGSPGRPDTAAAFRLPRSAGFGDLLAHLDPARLPVVPPGAVETIPHGTTIVALTFPDGVVMAGDRRATAGPTIAHRAIEKVFPGDDHSVVGIAGTAGLAIELVRLFQVELQHYEKIEGLQLSLDGKANRLSQMIRNNLGLAIQGLAVVPLFAGWDLDAGRGRIFSYDVTGGRYEETGFSTIGSGSVFARGSLKKLYSPGLDEADCVTAVLEALVDAADDDSATGGPDTFRGIYPVVSVVTASGYRRLGDEEVAAASARVLDGRRARPDGPPAGPAVRVAPTGPGTQQGTTEQLTTEQGRTGEGSTGEGSTGEGVDR